MMVALNRGDEFKMHVRAAFNNGVTRDEIKEVLLQMRDLRRRAGSELRVPSRAAGVRRDGRRTADEQPQAHGRAIISLSALTVLELSPPEMVTCARDAGYSHVGLRLIPATPTEPSYDTIGDTPIIRDTLARLADTGIEVLDVEILRLKPETQGRGVPRRARDRRAPRRAQRARRRQRSRRGAAHRQPRRVVRPRGAVRHRALPRAHALDRRQELRAGRAHRRQRRAAERGTAHRSHPLRPRRQRRQRDRRACPRAICATSRCATHPPSDPRRSRGCCTRPAPSVCFPAMADSILRASCAPFPQTRRSASRSRWKRWPRRCPQSSARAARSPRTRKLLQSL